MSDAAPLVRPDVAAFLAYLATVPGPKTYEMEPPAARMAYGALKEVADLPIGDLATIVDLSIPGPAGTLPARLFDARATREPGPAVMFFHGGGFVIGDLDSHASFCAEAARVLDLPVIAIHYRLAPENPWPPHPTMARRRPAGWRAVPPNWAGRSPASF